MAGLRLTFDGKTGDVVSIQHDKKEMELNKDPAKRLQQLHCAIGNTRADDKCNYKPKKIVTPAEKTHPPKNQKLSGNKAVSSTFSNTRGKKMIGTGSVATPQSFGYKTNDKEKNALATSKEELPKNLQDKYDFLSSLNGENIRQGENPRNTVEAQFDNNIRLVLFHEWSAVIYKDGEHKRTLNPEDNLEVHKQKILLELEAVRHDKPFPAARIKADRINSNPPQQNSPQESLEISSKYIDKLFEDSKELIATLPNVQGKRKITFDELLEKVNASSADEGKKESAQKLIIQFRDNPEELGRVYNIPYEFQGKEPSMNNLVSVSEKNKNLLSPEAKQAWGNLLKDWNSEYKGGQLPPTIFSSFRSPAYQLFVFARTGNGDNKEYRKKTFQESLSTSSLPSYSEHQNPGVVDVHLFAEYKDVNGKNKKNTLYRADDPQLVRDSDEYRAFRKVAEKNGFMESYPMGTLNVNKGFGEPWHWKYVGKTEAQKVSDQREENGEFGPYTLSRITDSQKDEIKNTEWEKDWKKNTLTLAKIMRGSKEDTFSITGVNAEANTRKVRKKLQVFGKMIQYQIPDFPGPFDGEIGPKTIHFIKEYLGIKQEEKVKD